MAPKGAMSEWLAASVTDLYESRQHQKVKLLGSDWEINTFISYKFITLY